MHSVGRPDVAQFYVEEKNKTQTPVHYKLSSGVFVDTPFKQNVTKENVDIKLRAGLTVDDLVFLMVSSDNSKNVLATAVLNSAGIFFRPEQVLAIIIAGIYANFY